MIYFQFTNLEKLSSMINDRLSFERQNEKKLMAFIERPFDRATPWSETSPLFPMTKFEQLFNDPIRRGSSLFLRCD